MQRLAISALVIVIMCAIGLRTGGDDFAAVWRRPGPLVLAVLVNLLAVPLLAVLALSVVELPAAATVGLLICAASPGGPTGSLFAMLARGHVATAVTAMVLLSLLSVVSAPSTITWALGLSAAVDAGHLSNRPDPA